ncbi:hypothetical protein [Paenibacillus sp. OK076]|uniref:hypothetical protein n=1 Tax=Paenibacillus sp. OK076 TaxID=1884379 RepID=UPI00210A2A8C|nr:hypothetical protein [Paenibacillus sp. OK076]
MASTTAWGDESENDNFQCQFGCEAAQALGGQACRIQKSEKALAALSASPSTRRILHHLQVCTDG